MEADKLKSELERINLEMGDTGKVNDKIRSELKAATDKLNEEIADRKAIEDN